VVRDDLGTKDAKRKALAIVDNQSTLLGEWDDLNLNLELCDLKALDFDLRLTGFEERELPGASRNDEHGAEMPELWHVVVACTSETQQVELLNRLTAEGFECRAQIL
jgi:hypothetical protein